MTSSLPVGSPDRWVKGLIESAVNVVRSYPGFPSPTHWDGELIAGARLGQFRHQSDSIKDREQQELIEKERRWVESQILASALSVSCFQWAIMGAARAHFGNGQIG